MNREKLKFILIDLASAILGGAFVAAGLSMFTIPNNIAPGGVSGFATAFVHLIHNKISVGIITAALNIPPMIIAWRKFGFRPLLTTIIATAVMSVLIDVFAVILPVYSNNVLLAAILGGVLIGIGTGVLFVRNASTGGTDLISLILKRYFPNLEVSKILMSIDVFVVIFAVCVFHNIEVALYSIVTIYVTSKVVDSIMQGVDYAKVIYVVTEKGDEINRALAEKIGRGVTLIPAKGGFTGREKQMLAVVIRRNEFSQTLGVIKSVDPASFTFAMSATEVHGEGFKQE